MQLSARNSLRGKVTDVRLGIVMAEVTLQVGSDEVTAVITRASAERMGLKAGDEATAILKATEVLVAKG